MKSNQTPLAIGAVIAIVIAIGVLYHFLKPAPAPPSTVHPITGPMPVMPPSVAPPTTH